MKLTPKQKPYLYGALGALILILLFRKKGGAAAAEAHRISACANWAGLGGTN